MNETKTYNMMTGKNMTANSTVNPRLTMFIRNN